MKSWLKSGLIGGIISVVLGIIASPFIFMNINKGIPDGFLWFLYPPMMIVLMDIAMRGDPLSMNQQIFRISIGIIFSILYYFVIGFVIGSVIGKLKSK